ncbi:MAG: amidase [Hyphomicrobiales bacterium]|nr:amidase [Hyphomicrobiales bacterium]MDE2113912.1 amidase [Hyphomicrobiales bacterium]
MENAITAMRAVDLRRAIGARTLSCREVMQASLDQIERFNPIHNAITGLIAPEILLKKADACDAMVASGAPLPLLHGFPHALKDLTATADMVCAMGSPILRDFVPVADSIMVERMRRSGAIFIGKTNVPEFGLGSHTFNPVHGITRNAFDPRLSAGGSSGGAAVALAMRMVPLADGSDMMGSLRNPAGWNHVCGFRPSFGRVPINGSGDVYFHQLATEGPMARNIEDLALLLSAQVGYDARAPLSLETEPAFDQPLTPADMRGKRIGWLGDLGGYLPMEAEVLAVCEAALVHFKAMGCEIAPVTPDFDMNRVWQSWIELRAFQVAASLGAFYDNPVQRPLLRVEAIYEIEAGRRLSAQDVARASLERSIWYQELRRLFTRYDYLVLPTAQTFAFDAQWRWPKTIGGRAMDSYHRWMEVVVPASLVGLPTLAVPAGFNSSGQAMGLQIIGPGRMDLSVLQIGLGYQEASGFTKIHPVGLDAA